MTTKAVLALPLFVFGLAACSGNTSTPTDQTGSMAYPEPLASGATTRPAVPIPDTGSMAQPNFPAATGTVRPGVTARDTGSMQQPSFSSTPAVK